MAEDGKVSGNTENWNLPVSIIVFLENITKNNESGRVLPWLYFKKIIHNIYLDRIKSNWEISGGLSNTFVNFDEFLCVYFLKVYISYFSANHIFRYKIYLY